MTILVLSAGRNPYLLKVRHEMLRRVGCAVTSAATSAELVNAFFDGDHDLLILCHSIPPEERAKLLQLTELHRPSMRTLVIGATMEDSLPCDSANSAPSDS